MIRAGDHGHRLEPHRFRRELRLLDRFRQEKGQNVAIHIGPSNFISLKYSSIFLKACFFSVDVFIRKTMAAGEKGKRKSHAGFKIHDGGGPGHMDGMARFPRRGD